MRRQRLERAPPPDTRADARIDAELPEQLERVAQTERDPLEHRAHERAAVVAQLEPDERGSRVGVGMRRALAREIRGEEQPFDAGRPRLGLLDKARRTAPPERRRRAATASEPAAESITPIACQVPGTA